MRHLSMEIEIARATARRVVGKEANLAVHIFAIPGIDTPAVSRLTRPQGARQCPITGSISSTLPGASREVPSTPSAPMIRKPVRSRVACSRARGASRFGAAPATSARFRSRGPGWASRPASKGVRRRRGSSGDRIRRPGAGLTFSPRPSSRPARRLARRPCCQRLPAFEGSTPPARFPLIDRRGRALDSMSASEHLWAERQATVQRALGVGPPALSHDAGRQAPPALVYPVPEAAESWVVEGPGAGSRTAQRRMFTGASAVVVALEYAHRTYGGAVCLSRQRRAGGA